MNIKYAAILVLSLFICQTAITAQENVVTLPLTVLDDKNNFYSDLQLSDLGVSIGGKNVRVEKVVTWPKYSLEIAILIDGSISQERVLPEEKVAAKYFIDTVLSKGDKVSIFKFTDSISQVQDLTADFQIAKNKINGVKIDVPVGYLGRGISAGQPPSNGGSTVGGTSVWEAIIQVSRYFHADRPQNVRRAIFLISDGFNTMGKTEMKEAISFSIRNNIPIYAIGIGDSYFSGVDKEALKKLTNQTNGVLVKTKTDSELKITPELFESFKIVEQSLRFGHDAVFTYVDESQRDEFQEVKIEIVNPQLRKRKFQIIKPKGFFVAKVK